MRLLKREGLYREPAQTCEPSLVIVEKVLRKKPKLSSQKRNRKMKKNEKYQAKTAVIEHGSSTV